MNTTEHILTCLAEEGSEVTKEATKALRFGINDTNFLKPDGPNNAERLVDELNDLMAVADMLAERGLIPPYWMDEKKVAAKKQKVLDCMDYAKTTGALTE